MKRIINAKSLSMKVAQTMTACMTCVAVAGLTDSAKYVTLTLMLSMVYVTLVWDD